MGVRGRQYEIFFSRRDPDKVGSAGEGDQSSKINPRSDSRPLLHP
jgi:hypothetical protein